MIDIATAARDAGRVPVISAPAFVGREQELAALQEALAKAAAVVLVEGEAGIGKTRLLAEALRRQPGGSRRSLVVACPPFREPCTLGPLVEALRQAVGRLRDLGLSGLAGSLRPLFPEWSADLPPAPEPLTDPTAARHRLFSALAELLARLEMDVLVVEDVHWADEATLEFLLFLRSRQGRQPSIVVSYRPEDLPGDSPLLRLSSRSPVGATGLRLTVPPLAVDETVSLVSSMLFSRRVSAEFAAFLQQSTDGIPLAVEELVRLMHDRADLAQRGGEWVRRSVDDIAVPVTIRDGVLERSRRLSADARAVLAAAAVLTDPASEPTLRAVAGLPAGRTATALAEVLRCGLLGEDRHGTISFRHVLACRAVYEAISPPERRQLHGRAGQALERQPCPPIAQLTRHFREAGEAAAWCGYAEQAADLALAAGDEGTALTLLQDVLVSSDLPASLVIRLIKKMPFGSFTQQAQLRDLARTLRAVLDVGVPDLDEEADVRMLLGRVLLVITEREEGRAEVERVIEQLPPNSVEAARAAIILGWPTATTWPASAHRKWLDRAADLSASMPPADRLNLTVERASALLMLGEEAGWDVAAQIPADAPSLQERQHVTKAHLNIGNMAMAIWGRYEEARTRLAKALELAEGHKYWLYRDMILVTQVHLDWLTGAWNGLAERAAALAGKPDSYTMTRLEAVLVSGLLHGAAGDSDGAEKDLDLVLTEIRQRTAIEAWMEPAAALARLRLADGRVDDALEITDEPMGILTAKKIWVWATDIAPVRVEALLAAGRAGEAGDLVETFGRGLHGRDAPAPAAALVLCQALLPGADGDHSLAGTLFARAAAAWQRLPRPYEALLARERQGRCQLAAGNGPAGLPILSEVLKGLSDLGARGDAMRVIRTLNEHGVQAGRPWLSGRRSYGHELSPRELDVVRLLLDGRTNRRIAEALFLSPKTVACHVNSAMRKLGVSSRAALAVRAMEVGFGRDSAPSEPVAATRRSAPAEG